MYLDFYNLTEFPFTLSCVAKFFYESPGHGEALANMMYTVQQRKGMVLVTGEVGAGKTFLTNMLGSRLGAGAQVIRLQNPPQSAKQLVKSLASQLGVTLAARADKLEMLEELQDHLTRLASRGRLVALILDESQDLSDSSLEELRLLWNWESSGQRLIQIILVGQPELREKLAGPRWEPLRQRIVLSYHLRGLSAEDTARYIDHRLDVASANGRAVEFTEPAKQAIHDATDGIPRLISALCDNALLVGYAREARRIDLDIINAVLQDMTCWNLQPAAQPPPVDPTPRGEPQQNISPTSGSVG